MTWALIGIGLVLAVSFVVYAYRTQGQLLGELKQAMQYWRARVHELETQREQLVERLGQAQGIGIERSASGNGEPLRSCWVDPEDGATYFSDGEVRDRAGRVLMRSGSNEVEPEAMVGIPEEED